MGVVKFRGNTMKMRVQQSEHFLRGSARVSVSFPKHDLNFINATILNHRTALFPLRRGHSVQTVLILINYTINNEGSGKPDDTLSALFDAKRKAQLKGKGNGKGSLLVRDSVPRPFRQLP